MVLPVVSAEHRYDGRRLPVRPMSTVRAGVISANMLKGTLLLRLYPDSGYDLNLPVQFLPTAGMEASLNIYLCVVIIC